MDIYVAPKWDSGETWLASMQHIARESGSWVIGCATRLEVSDIPHYATLFPNKYEWINLGDTVVYKPFGGIAVGPMHKEKGLLFAEIDVKAARASRRKFGAAGHYARPDVFSWSVDRSLKNPVTFHGTEAVHVLNRSQPFQVPTWKGRLGSTVHTKILVFTLYVSLRLPLHPSNEDQSSFGRQHVD